MNQRRQRVLARAVPLAGWARIRVAHHTPWLVVIGGAIGAAVAAVVFTAGTAFDQALSKGIVDIFMIVTGTLLVLLIGAAGLRAMSQLRHFRSCRTHRSTKRRRAIEEAGRLTEELKRSDAGKSRRRG